jgi:hypothetical protein
VFCAVPTIASVVLSIDSGGGSWGDVVKTRSRSEPAMAPSCSGTFKLWYPAVARLVSTNEVLHIGALVTETTVLPAAQGVHRRSSSNPGRLDTYWPTVQSVIALHDTAPLFCASYSKYLFCGQPGHVRNDTQHAGVNKQPSQETKAIHQNSGCT